MDIQDDIDRAVGVLRRGGVILYPTDTVWGIGCDATCSEAVRRIFEIKRRPESKALISLVGSSAMLEQALGRSVSDTVRRYITSSDRPVTVVYGNVRGLAPELLASDGSAALRITHEEFSSRLCNALGKPLVSTSANVSGHPAAASFSGINEDILSAVDYSVHYRRSEQTSSLPSKVVRIGDDDSVTVIRP